MIALGSDRTTRTVDAGVHAGREKISERRQSVSDDYHGRVKHFLSPLLESPGRWELTIERTGDILVERVELARDSVARKRGLLGRERLDEGDGLVIAPSQGVHTFGMRFPLDIVAVARDGRVVKVRSRVPVRRLVIAWSAFAIIELAEGTIEQRKLVVGDRILLRLA